MAYFCLGAVIPDLDRIPTARISESLAASTRSDATQLSRRYVLANQYSATGSRRSAKGCKIDRNFISRDRSVVVKVKKLGSCPIILLFKI
jgi:hypothetical protein